MPVDRSAEQARALLEVEDLRLSFGGVRALDGVSFSVRRGEVFGLIGPNGAGKSTLFNCISRLYTPDRGDIRFEGRSLLNLPPHRVPAVGIARTFQNVELFKSMTVLENLLAGQHLRLSYPLWSAFLSLPDARRQERAARERALEVARMLGLGRYLGMPAAALPLGLQKRVELGRALVMRPKLLLLDEPAGGLNPAEVAELADLIRQIRDLGITLIVVEHHMGLVMGLCERIAVLDFGRKIAEGPPEAVQNDPRVIEAYLGEEEEIA
jgi:ABC-type branched-subunit amino acid transport system ATPase component